MYKLIQQGELLQLNNLPKCENVTVFSVLNELSKPLSLHNFSIKYVLEGCEHYQLNGNKYKVKTGEYLLANAFCEGKIEIDSSTFVKGICIDLSPEVLSEAFGNFITPDSPSPDIALDDFFNSEAFLENKYDAGHTGLGNVLGQTGRQFNENPFHSYHLDSDFSFTLAERIIEDHRSTITQLYSIKTVKHHTRKDLYRRLCKGKLFLESNYNKNISIRNAAEYATLSEYHFFRLFKAAFDVTPQQYLIRYRLFNSMELLRTGNYSVTEASAATGFSDVFSFSKSFKKHFGMSPSNFSRRQVNNI